ncbi:MAG: cyanophycinase [Bacteroidales bacterium]|nr:cyanophycinase [Bacteroidales bacterium]
MKSFYPVLFFLVFSVSCNVTPSPENNIPKGSLFIIGGGSRPGEMVQDMIRLSGTDTAGYIAILPMASTEPDTSFYYASRQFREQGIEKILDLRSGTEGLNEDELELLINASMIYIPGGAQAAFMDSVRNTNVFEAIHEAYWRGAMIAGTSAGAAVQSKLMITGDQKKYPVYTGNFETIEANNIVLEEGLGLIESIIVDQHFIRRQRLNRLISVVLENPGKTGVGIDESTAIHVQGDSATVYGVSQVVVLENPSGEVRIMDGLLGGKKLSLSVYLPGDRFRVR